MFIKNISKDLKMGNQQGKEEEVIINNNNAGLMQQKMSENLTITQIILIIIGLVILIEIIMYGSVKIFQKIIKREVARNAVISV